jgi:DNA replication protein DnaC
VCKGAGFVHPLLPSGKPDFGQVVPCRCRQKERESQRQARLQRYSHLGSLNRLSFDNLEPEGRSGHTQRQQQFRRAYELARAFAAEPRGWLVLSGPSGSGKTHLAAAIANERIRTGHHAFYITAADLLDHLRTAFGSNSEMPYDEFFDQVRNAPLLVLDDLGVQTGTAWAREKLDQLLTHRFNSKLPTVIVPIVPLAEMEERIQVRLTDPELSQICRVEEKPSASLDYSWETRYELQRSMTFNNFDYRRANLSPEQQENLKEAYRIAFEFAKSPEGWIVFMGDTGCGKTHLAAAIVNYSYQAGQPAFFVVVPEFLDHLRSTFSPDSKVSYDQLFEKVKTAPLLVLDDFGEQTTTPWVREKLYQVINYRYNARLPMVITTRYSLEDIHENIESSISSRLVDPKISTPFNIIVPDYRGDSASLAKTPRRGRRGR